MKEIIMAVMCELQDGVTFVELENRVPGFIGTNNWIGASNGEKYLVFWSGISEEAIRVLIELVTEKKLAYDRYDRTLDLYKIDGKILGYPSVESRSSQTARWVPIEWRLAS